MVIQPEISGWCVLKEVKALSPWEQCMAVGRFLRPKDNNCSVFLGSLLSSLSVVFFRKRLEMLWAFPSIIVPLFLILYVTSIAVLLKVWSTSLQMMYWLVDERMSLSQILITMFLSADFVVVMPHQAKDAGGKSQKACWVGYCRALSRREMCLLSRYFSNTLFPNWI